MKSGNLNFLEPSGPLQACNGTAWPWPLPLVLRRQYWHNTMRVAWDGDTRGFASQFLFFGWLENEFGGPKNTRRIYQLYKIIIGEPEGNRANAKDNIKRILKKEVMSCRLDLGCTFGFHKMRGISWLAQKVLVKASQEEFWSVALVLWIYTTEQTKAQKALYCRCYVLHFLLY